MRAGEDTRGEQGNNMTIRAKKGQEEIVGFVLIVVLVAVIFLVFLGLMIRREAPATTKDSRDVFQFLESLSEYTTDCAISSVPAYSNIGGLIKECYDKAQCTSGNSACDVLNRTLREAIEASWKVGPSRPVKGYALNSTYYSEARTEQVMLINVGNCTGTIIGSEKAFSAAPGTISTSLKICY